MSSSDATAAPDLPDRPDHQGRANVVVLASGTGSLLQCLVDAAAARSTPFRVAGVITDRGGVQALDRARAAGVPTAVVAPSDFESRELWDAGVAKAVEVFKPDLVVLAGFMRLLGESFLSRWGSISINSHPALLPAFPGAHAVRDALAYGVKVTGTSIILLDAGVDSGPVVAQRAVDVLAGDDEVSLHERIKVVEREQLLDVVTSMTGRGWKVADRKVVLS